MVKIRRSSRGRTADGSPNPIDVYVGARVKMRRTLLGMSQEKLGEAIGLTFQQVQKYERGLNRISASRLFDISKVLEVPIGFFSKKWTIRSRNYHRVCWPALPNWPKNPFCLTMIR